MGGEEGWAGVTRHAEPRRKALGDPRRQKGPPGRRGKAGGEERGARRVGVGKEGWGWGGCPLGGVGGWGPCPGLKEIWSVFQDIDLIDILWRQDIDLGAGREIFDYSHRQKESEVDKELSDGRERGDSWRSGGNEVLDRNLLVDGETGESFPAQVTPLGPTGWGSAPAVMQRAGGPCSRRGGGEARGPAGWLLGRAASRVTFTGASAEPQDKGLPGWTRGFDAGKAQAASQAGEPQSRRAG